MHAVAGKRIVAYWLAAAGIVGLVHVLGRAPEVWAQPAGWRAAAGPFAIAVLSLAAAWRLLRRDDGFRFATIILATQLFTVSFGPLAYRLDVGPFVRVGVSNAAAFTDAGSDARLLLILGSGNRVPSGIALNVLALGALALLLASHRSANEDLPAL